MRHFTILLAGFLSMLCLAGPSFAEQTVDVTVDANAGWMHTGIMLEKGAKASIRYARGRWTIDPNSPCGPTGLVNNVAKDGYALPGAPTGALIGKVNKHIFLVGGESKIPTAEPGELLLSVNDDIDHHYGDGLADNSGSIDVIVTIE